MEQTIKKPKTKVEVKDLPEVREFVKIIHLKLKRHKPQDNKVASLYDLITQ
jgi:hypothetical protein